MLFEILAYLILAICIYSLVEANKEERYYIVGVLSSGGLLFLCSSSYWLIFPLISGVAIYGIMIDLDKIGLVYINYLFVAISVISFLVGGIVFGFVVVGPTESLTPTVWNWLETLQISPGVVHSARKAFRLV